MSDVEQIELIEKLINYCIYIPYITIYNSILETLPNKKDKS